MCNNCGCSDNNDGCGDEHGHEDHGHSHEMGKWELDCCQDHKMSKDHLEAKKAMLEEKLAWVNEQLGKGE